MNWPTWWGTTVVFFAVAATATTADVVSEPDADLEVLIGELRMELTRDRRGVKRSESRATTVQALIHIAQLEFKTGGNRRLLGMALEELGEYPESRQGMQYLVETIAYQGGPVRDQDPLSPYPAAMSLVRIGSHCRRHILSSTVGASDHKLRLMAHVLVRIDQTGEDLDSGPIIGVNRLMREIQRKEAIEVEPESEAQKATAIANLRQMIEFMTEPRFLAKTIGPPESSQP